MSRDDTVRAPHLLAYVSLPRSFVPLRTLAVTPSHRPGGIASGPWSSLLTDQPSIPKPFSDPSRVDGVSIEENSTKQTGPWAMEG